MESGNTIISNRSNKTQTLDVQIANLVLTPLTCVSIISEILKCLIYEKSLIPYPYNWLKSIVNEQKLCKTLVDNEDIFASKHQLAARTAFDVVENIITNLKRLFKFGNNVSEIIILIGATPLSPKEVYTFQIPKLARGHNERNHYSLLAKFQPKILRSVFLSQEWMNKMDKSIPLTNLFLFVKIHDGCSFMLDDNTLEHFMPSSSFFVPKSAQCLNFNLLYDDSVHNCCTNLTVYADNNIDENTSNLNESNKSDSVKNNDEFIELNVDYVQCNFVLKGFKEVFKHNS